MQLSVFGLGEEWLLELPMRSALSCGIDMKNLCATDGLSGEAKLKNASKHMAHQHWGSLQRTLDTLTLKHFRRCKRSFFCSYIILLIFANPVACCGHILGVFKEN